MTPLPTGWTAAPLGEVATVDRETVAADDIAPGTMYVGLEDIDAGGAEVRAHPVEPGQLGSNKFRFDSGHILYGKLRPYLAKIVAAPVDGICSTDILPVRPTRVDQRYLLHFLRQPAMVDHATARSTGANLPRLAPKALESFEVPLPPLAEQRRIAAILDKADELRAKRRAAVEQLASVAESLFLEVLAEYPNIPSVTVESVAAHERGAIRTGPFGSQLLHSEFVDQGVRVLGIDNVVTNEFRWAEPRHVTHEKYKTLRRFTVYPGDVLVTIMGTCGRAAVVPDDVPLAINTKHLCCITVNREVAEPRWLHAALLYDRKTRQQLGERAKGAVMPGLNMGLIKATAIPLPALAVQQQFVARLETVTHLGSSVSSSGAELGALSLSLQTRAFRGEL